MALHALAGDALIRVAYLPDETKLAHEPGYPSPSVRDRILETGMRFEQISAAQVCDGVLSEFTTLLVPGGFAPNIERALGDAGADAIRAFVQSGGGFVGICAGAFLGSAWGLGLLPVELSDASDRCWNRGEGVLKLNSRSWARRCSARRPTAACGTATGRCSPCATAPTSRRRARHLRLRPRRRPDGGQRRHRLRALRPRRSAARVAAPRGRRRRAHEGAVSQHGATCRRATADEAGAAAPPGSAAADAARAEARARTRTRGSVWSLGDGSCLHSGLSSRTSIFCEQFNILSVPCRKAGYVDGHCHTPCGICRRIVNL